MTDKEVIEILLLLQDLNKELKFNATTEEQIKNCESTERSIQRQFKYLYVN